MHGIQHIDARMEFLSMDKTQYKSGDDGSMKIDRSTLSTMMKFNDSLLGKGLVLSAPVSLFGLACAGDDASSKKQIHW